MRFLICLVSLTSAIAAESGTYLFNNQNEHRIFHINPILYDFSSLPGMPSFKINGYSRANIPEMSVTFENGITDDLLLEPYSKSACNFIGKLKSYTSSLAVTGCMNNPGDKMHITLLSELNTKSAMYELDFHGHLSALENPFKNQPKGKSVLGIHLFVVMVLNIV